MENPPPELMQAKEIAQRIWHIGSVVAIAYGTQITNVSLGHGIHRVTMLAWKRADRQQYLLRDLDVTYEVKLKRFIPSPQDYSTIFFVRSVNEENIDVRFPDLDDISRIEEEESYQTARQFTPTPEQTDWWQPSSMDLDPQPSAMSEQPDPPPAPPGPPAAPAAPASLQPPSPHDRSRSRGDQSDLQLSPDSGSSPAGPPPPPAEPVRSDAPMTPKMDRSRSRHYSPPAQHQPVPEQPS